MRVNFSYFILNDVVTYLQTYVIGSYNKLL